VQAGPPLDQAERRSRPHLAIHEIAFKVERSPFTLIFRVEVRKGALVVEHPDEDAEEGRDRWHSESLPRESASSRATEYPGLGVFEQPQATHFVRTALRAACGPEPAVMKVGVRSPRLAPAPTPPCRGFESTQQVALKQIRAPERSRLHRDGWDGGIRTRDPLNPMALLTDFATWRQREPRGHRGEHRDIKSGRYRYVPLAATGD
jgi:hypothetical protein